MYVCVLLGDVHKPGVAGRVHWTGTKVPKSLKIVIATH